MEYCNKPVIYFRASANAVIGWGHLYRLIALSQLLGDNFYKILTSDSLPFEVSSPELKTFDEVKICHQNELVAYVKTNDIVVADGYDFHNDFFKSLKENEVKTVYIDDVFRNDLEVDVIINHAPGIIEKQYGKFKNRPPKLYLGLDYALIRKAFYEKNRGILQAKQSDNNLFVCLGGSESSAVDKKLLTLFKTASFFEHIYWVKADENEIIKKENITIYPKVDTNTLIELQQNCAFAFVPASTISIECFCMNMKLLLIQTAANQENIYKGLIKYPQVYSLGNLLDQSTSEIQTSFESSIKELRSRKTDYKPHLDENHLIQIFKELSV